MHQRSTTVRGGEPARDQPMHVPFGSRQKREWVGASDQPMHVLPAIRQFRDARGLTGHELREAEIAALAAHQHGVVAVGQLRALGISPSGISRRVRQGRLHRLHQGVYTAGTPLLSPLGARAGAVLAYGAGARASHTSAAAGWDVDSGPGGDEHVTLPAPRRGRPRPGVRVHHSAVVHPEDEAVVDGIAVTSLARTLTDLGDVVRADRVRRAFLAAERARIVDIDAIERAIERGKGRRGARVLREVVDAYDPRWQETRSELELMMLDALAGSGLPEPEVNVWVASRFIVDFLWRAQRLAVETDGSWAHGTANARRADARRDQTLRRMGLTVLRVSYTDVSRRPGDVVARIATALAAASGR